MADFEMPLKDGGHIRYEEKSNTIIIQDQDYDIVEIEVDDLIRFTKTNFWKYLSKNSVISK